MVSVKNVVLGIAIFLLAMFVGIYGIRAFYGAEPKYENFCLQNMYINQSNCELGNGTWINNGGQVVSPEVPTKVIPGGYCDTTICQKNWDAANEKYTKGVFFIAAPLGVIMIAIGALVFGLEFVGAGLMAGGVGIIFFGVMGYWRFTTDWWKFIILLVGLLVVIWIGYFLNKRLGSGFLKLRKKKEEKK
jgi:hypothetical protein